MARNAVITLALIILLIAAIAIATLTYTPRHTITPPPTATPDSLIHIDSPKSGATVPHSFSVMGSARGSWYFEASFPIHVLDSSGNIIATTQAHAQGDWMTDEFVPFSTTLLIPSSYTGNAILKLEKDNPSGLPQNDASRAIPIVIQ